MRRWWIPALAGTVMIASSQAEETAPPAETKAEPAPAVEQAPPAATPAAGAPVRRGGKKSAKGGKPREKDAEGSEAADRFEADTVIKSKYKLNGESLEVDPD